MNTNTVNALPYVQIQSPPLKLLIDTGSFISIIKPSVIEDYFPECIVHSPSIIKTSLGEKEIRYKAKIPAFNEFQCNYEIDFTLFNFHEYFDGIIGLKDLISMNLGIDFQNQRLVNEYHELPFYYRQPDEISFKFEIPSNETLIKDYPVTVKDGEIIVPPCKINNLVVPETLTFAKNYRAYFEIYNYTDKTITVDLQEAFPAIPLCNQFEMHNINISYENSFQPMQKSDFSNLIRTNHMNADEREAIIKICEKYSDVFHKEDEILTFTNQVKHDIKTKDEIPVHTRSYRFPYCHKTEVKTQIDKMLKDGIIRPSSSPWSSPIWIVPKKPDASGKRKWRIVVDYRKLNEKTVDDRYPIPNITDILDKLGRCNYFSTLDLASGFHQIEMDKNSIPKTAFNVEHGHFEYLKMPFGLKNAPATFQRLMDNVLKDLQGKICLVYMDDIIIFSTSLQEHIANLKLIFDKLRQSRLKIQLDKSEFLRKEVEFLGHIVTPEGVKPNPNKIKVIQNFPIPKTARDIKSFLGLLGYYRRFIKDFAKLTKPFTKCLKKGQKIEHTPEFLECFENCKKLLINDPILIYPDFSKEFNLTTDASNFSISGILSQGPIGNDRPVAYASRTLNPAEQNYSVIERELLSIVNFTKYFRPYLFGRKFNIVTDHKPLVWLFNMKDPNSRLVRWRLKLEEFDYKIIHKKGKENTNADCLSRIEVNVNENESVIPNYDLSENNKLISDFSETNPLKNPENTKTLSTSNETQHSSVENPIISIPITDDPVNMYKNQLLITHSKQSLATLIRKSHDEYFGNTRHTLIIPKVPNEQALIGALKQFFTPRMTYTLKFIDLDVMPFVITTIQNHFKYDSVKFRQSNTLLKDVTEESRQKELIKYHHEGKTCHKGINEVKTSLSKLYYWPKMIDDITLYINSCEICQKSKYERHPNKIIFQNTPIGNKPFDLIYIDTFKISNQTFLTIIDSFSRYAQAYPILLNSIDLLNAILIFISHFGIPRQITSDGGSEFHNHALIEFCKKHKIKLHFTTIYNPNSNSPVERFHSTISEDLRILKLTNPAENIKVLMSYAIIGYNNSYHSSTKYTPFQIVKGDDDKQTPFDLSDDRIVTQYVQNHQNLMSTIFERVKINNDKSRLIDKTNDNRILPPRLEKNQKVYIKGNLRDSKITPKYKCAQVKQNLDNKFMTSKNKIYHKMKLKPERKLKPPIVSDNVVCNDHDYTRTVVADNADKEFPTTSRSTH